jgi:catechol 2,3-dioxygenase-like lactoylglutathione lyase family enzyme
MGDAIKTPALERILETVLYGSDLGAMEQFYRSVLGAAVFSKAPGRHVFFKLERQMLLLFDPNATEMPSRDPRLPVPPHGARGPGHVCFSASTVEIDAWRVHLTRHGVAIEADFEWPGGGRSIYFRDPAGNCIEFAEPRIWGLP